MENHSINEMSIYEFEDRKEFTAAAAAKDASCEFNIDISIC